MKAVADTRKPYSGLTRSLVIAIDVGTTFSGVSYAILIPGEIPDIRGVVRFPGQEHVAGNSKIPSILYYDKRGDLKAAGAEADSSTTQATAEDEGWVKVELFKLRLRPRTMHLSMNGLRLGPLPGRKSPVHVFGDFLSYLYTCTTSFIRDTHANGPALLAAVIPEHVEFVLAHPNGWEGAQQAKMRRAAVYAGLVSDTAEGRARVRFVTEGEASLHACVLSGLAVDVLSNPSKHGFLIADAGGGTLDISSYAIKGTNPLVMEEIAPPDCIFAGSVFVSRRAREFFEQKLKGSQYGTAASLDHITRRFDETTKRLFRDRRDQQFVPFGSPFDRDQAFGIRAGQLRLTGAEVANLFEPSVDAAFNAIKKQIEACHGMIRSVFLVGGYAASPWLFTQLQERLGALHITVSRPDTQTSKAVADGAIGFYCDHHVSARMARFMYGVEYLRQLDPNDPEHIARKEKLCELPSGPKLLPDAFDCILARGVKVKESTVFTRKYCTELTSLSMLKVFEVEIWCYRGGNTIPKWIERNAEAFSTLCVVRADLSMLSDSAAPKQGKNNKNYWTIVFSVEIHFGLTEFRARIKWVQDGQTKYGPATIVYNERGHRSDEDEPDFFPEDDAITATSSARADRNRSEPSSRARTPTDGHYVDSSRRSTRDRDSYAGTEPSRPPSIKPPSNPSTPNHSIHASLEKDRDSERRRSTHDKDKESRREREHRDRDRSVAKSSRNSMASSSVPKPEAHSRAPSGTAASVYSSRSRPRTPATPGLEYVDPPSHHASPSRGASPALWDPHVRDGPGDYHSSRPPPLSNAPSIAPSFEDRPRSMFGSSATPPKSIFGEDPKSAFVTPKSVFGDSAAGGGPAADMGDRPKSIFEGEAVGGAAASTSMSVFGEPATAIADDKNAASLWDDPADSGTTATGNNWNDWGAPPPPPAAATPAPTTPAPTTPAEPSSAKSSKKKTPKASPAVSRAPSGQGQGAASKAPSPNAKSLSPLNPAAQPPPAEDAASGPNGTTAQEQKDDSAAAPPVEEAPPATPVTPGDEATTPGGSKKKRKKGGAAAAAAAVAAAAEKEEEERKKREEEKNKQEEEDRKKQEKEERKKKQQEEAKKKLEEENRKKREEEEEKKKQEEEAKRVQEEEEKKKEEQEQKQREKEARLAQEEEERKARERLAQEEEARKERERLEQEEKDRKERERIAKEESEKERKAREKQEREDKRKKEKEEKERKKKEEEEKKEKERLEKEEKDRKKKEKEEAQRKKEEEDEKKRKEEEEEKKKKEEEAEKKRMEEAAENKRKEEEEAAKKKLEEEEENKRKEEEAKRQEEARKKQEEEQAELQKLNDEEERLKRELEELDRQEKERVEKEEKEKADKEKADKEKADKEKAEKEKAEQEEKEKSEKESALSFSFGGGRVSSIFGSTTSLLGNLGANLGANIGTNIGANIGASLFGDTSIEPPATATAADTAKPDDGLGGFGSAKKKGKKSKDNTPISPSSAQAPSNSFGWGFGSGGGQTADTSTSLFGDIKLDNLGLDDPSKSLFGDTKVDLGLDDPTKPADAGQTEEKVPSRAPTPKPAEVVETATAEEEDPWGTWGAQPKTKKKKGKNNASNNVSEQPTRAATPQPELDAAPAADENADAGDDGWGGGIQVKGKKKKKNNKANADPAPAAPAPAAEAEEGVLDDALADLLAGGESQEPKGEDDDFGPTKSKKKKKGKGGAGDVGAQEDAPATPVDEFGGGGGGGGKKKKKGKK